MSFEIIYTKEFGKELKRLSSKYPSVKADFLLLINQLEIDPIQGTPLGKDCYKIRMSISSKGKGRSGGGRVITCIKLIRNTVYLVGIYDKSEKATMSNKEIQQRINPYQ